MRRFWIIPLSLLVIGAAMRALAIQDSFWLDEIWSYFNARQVHSLSEVFTRFRIDNNHPLNTIILWLMGDRANWTLYRAPVAVAGVGTIGLSGLWLARFGKMAMVVGMTLMTISFPMLVYSTEARGYGYAIFFAMICLLCAQRTFKMRVLLYWVAAILGLLSHLTFIPFLLALIVWTALRKQRLENWIAMQAVPMIATTVLYFGFIRHLEVGGGPKPEIGTVLAESLSMVLGQPPRGAGLGFAIIGVVTACAVAGNSLRVAKNDRWELYLLGIVVCPIAVLVVRVITSNQYVYVYPRYLLIPMMLALLLLSEWLGAMLLQNRVRQAIALAALATLVGTNGWCDHRFLRAGRGDPLGAMCYMAQHTRRPAITILSANFFRTQVELQFYSRYVSTDKAWRVVEGEITGELPEWLLSREADPDPVVQVGSNSDYRPVATFPHFGPSGWTLVLYQHN